MNRLEEIIKNYLQNEENYALQIDGKWGTGKTFFIKNSIIPGLEEQENLVVYFSVYGFSSLEELKKELFYQIISVLSEKKDIWDSINKLNKKFQKISDFIYNNNFKSFSSITDLIIETYKDNYLKNSINNQVLVIFIDDLERLSNKIDLNDLLGFILNEILENMKFKVVFISNSLEILNSDKFQKIKEKLISRTVKFEHNISDIENLIFKNHRNQFIKENSQWIKNLLLSQYELKNKEVLNLRTLFSILTSFDFIESELRSKINELEPNLKNKIKKSIFLNIFVITIEYKLGNLTEKNFNLLNGIMENRNFLIYTPKDEEKTIRECIINKYHNSYKEFDDNIYYSKDVSKYIILGYMDKNDYVEKWMRAFFPESPEMSKLDELRNFRRYDDEKVKEIQESLLEDIKQDKLKFEEILSVYSLLYNFKNINLMFLEDDYLETIETKMLNTYNSEDLEINENVADIFFLSGFTNIKVENPDLFEKFEKIKNKKYEKKAEVFIINLFDDNHEEVRKYKRSTLSTNINIFEVMLNMNVIDEYIVKKMNKADILWQYIRENYLNISNSKDFHGKEVEDVKLFLSEINEKLANSDLGKIDNFKIKQLKESLEELIEHLS
ncbi:MULTISPECIES: P-loop NTPase fold protein [Enterococcus]|uniref:KAP NTPase domain-containing protein n=1 Tax=Enterococcus sulfureus ATCC 49903 TaxID=1140003 RepID=S0PFW6_9ENTE|nr:P-loop NTPase fold protein [Enterococcus sulfureus]EOT49444.1 hypothetical protein OMY_00372 [Enterococcus sulfureus ATCC 49903]EOT87311.1 hypothetical protein I573_00367 [Enterococcus sulfureus ATCC 49903]